MEETAPKNFVLEDLKLELTLIYLKVRRPLLGKQLEEEKRLLNKLSLSDRGAEKLLKDFAERLERGLKIGKIIPNNAITLRRLYLEHRRVREAYNQAAKRFQAKLEYHGGEALRMGICSAVREFERKLNELSTAPLERPKLQIVSQTQKPKQRLRF
jgi:hypothetical protein